MRGADFGRKSRTKWKHLAAEDTTFVATTFQQKERSEWCGMSTPLALVVAVWCWWGSSRRSSSSTHGAWFAHAELDQTPWLPKERQDQVRASHAEPSKPRDINPWAMRNDPLRQKAEARMAGMGDINTAGRVVRGKRKAELMGK